jgi:tryptophan-rich sensory protein
MAGEPDFMEYADPGKPQSYGKLIAAVLLCLVLGSMGSLVTATGSGSWYESLEKPVFSPPNWVFGPVWTTLFILMGIALYFVWQSGTERRDVQIALAVFGIQFALNILWSFFFFGMQSPLLGLVDIVLLWIMIAVTIVLFYQIRKIAGYLLIPYIVWVTIATALNYSIYILNP